MRLLFLLPLLLHLLVGPAYAEVLSLDDASFTNALSQGQAYLVTFYAPWCKHSKAWRPVQRVVANKMVRGDPVVAEVDVTESKALAARLGVRGLPAIKLVKDGYVYEYAGARKLSHVLAFARGGFTSRGRRRVPRENERFADVPLEQADDVDVLERNFYRVLGVGKRANPAHIKQAYRKLSLRYHPDKNKAAGAHDKFLLVAKAYKVLSRPNSRDDYDVELEMGGGDRAASSVYNEDMDLYSALNAFSDIFDTAGDGRFVQQDGKTDWAKVLEQASAKFTGADGELDVSSLGRSIMNVMQQFAGGSGGGGIEGGGGGGGGGGGVNPDGGGWSDIGQTVSGTLRQVLSSDEAPTSKTRSRKRRRGGYSQSTPRIKRQSSRTSAEHVPEKGVETKSPTRVPGVATGEPPQQSMSKVELRRAKLRSKLQEFEDPAAATDASGEGEEDEEEAAAVGGPTENTRNRARSALPPVRTRTDDLPTHAAGITDRVPQQSMSKVELRRAKMRSKLQEFEDPAAATDASGEGEDGEAVGKTLVEEVELEEEKAKASHDVQPPVQIRQTASIVGRKMEPHQSMSKVELRRAQMRSRLQEVEEDR